ncbi:uncharacterized protein LOC110994330 isoform X2 [Pieris rapae]|uniref:uncharacterized protein LOC110994330 isoform X2 n=1 Tax=Pieris rapae TaxID=64459 RepID=UPI001E27AE7B|nr:uncharacterized protein LOC110994330 isoform X2 [Pieris rapae]
MLPIKILYVSICLNYVVGQSTDIENTNLIFLIDEPRDQYDVLRHILGEIHSFIELDYTTLVYNSASVKISDYTKSHRQVSKTQEVAVPTTLEEYTRDLLFVIDLALSIIPPITKISDYKNSYIFVLSNYQNPVHTSAGLSNTLREALKKHVQVSFLTTEFLMTEVSAHYEISLTLSNATGGVFLPIDELNPSVLWYIKDELIHKWILVDTKILNAYYEHTVFGFTVDKQTINEYSIIVIGDEAELLSLTNYRNEAIEYMPKKLSKYVVASVFKASTGLNFAHVTCYDRCQVIIRATSKLSFTPGFSAGEPSPRSIIFSSPLTYIKSYLTIKVEKYNENIDILSAEVYNRNDWSQSLKIHKIYENFYASDEPLFFPEGLIGVRINGVINDSNETFTSIYPRLILPFDQNDSLITLTISIGDNLTLECPVQLAGEWMFSSSGHSTLLALSTGIHYFKIKWAGLEDAGIYLCVKNSTIITSYKVRVQAPPTISRVRERIIIAVIGDPVVVMTCLATGSPEPNVTWSFNHTKECTKCSTTVNNSLVLHNVTADSAGTYTCKAQNSLGSAWEYYVLTVQGAPSQSHIRKTLVIIKDRKSNIDCKIPHSEEDIQRWYRDGNFLMNGNLRLHGRLQDSGVYTCRVIGLAGMMEYTVNLTVCLPPRFIRQEPSTVAASTILHCNVADFGEYKFTWAKDGVKFKVIEPIIFAKQPGLYTCEVTSHCGKISRQFNVVKGGCILKVDSEFDGIKPFILHSKGHLLSPMYNTLNDAVFVENGKSVRFHCGLNISLYHDKHILSDHFVEGQCLKGSHFKIKGRSYDFKNLSCERRLNKIVRNDEVRCGFRKHLKNINYHFGMTSVRLYEVCVADSEPVYIRHRLNKARANTITLEDTPQLFENRQYLENKCFSDNNDSGFCFKSRQLLNARDVYPGQAFTTTFSNYNIVPEWRHERSNWEELEGRVRMVANSAQKSAEVYVYNGVIYTSNLKKHIKRTVTPNDNYTVIYKNIANQQNIKNTPMFLFKAVHNFNDRTGVAFIQLNNPNVTQEKEAEKYVFCVDICEEIEWLGNGDWKNPKRGYIYCCTIKEFNIFFSNVLIIQHTNGVLKKI